MAEKITLLDIQVEECNHLCNELQASIHHLQQMIHELHINSEEREERKEHKSDELEGDDQPNVPKEELESDSDSDASDVDQNHAVGFGVGLHRRHPMRNPAQDQEQISIHVDHMFTDQQVDRGISALIATFKSWFRF